MVLDAAQQDDFGRSVAVQDDGKIVVAGFFYNGSDHDFVAARFSPEGALDLSFGTDGVAIADFSGDNDRAHRVTIGAGGSVTLTGFSQSGSTLELAETRFTAEGLPDPSFGPAGQSKSPTSEPESDLGARAVALDDGTLLTAGQLWNGSNFDFALRRFLLDGGQDPTFGDSGSSAVDFAGGDDEARSIAILDSGKILAVGDAWVGDRYKIALARFLPDGTLDTTFGAVIEDDVPTGATASTGTAGGGGAGGRNISIASTPADTWSAEFASATSYYNLYAAYGYFYHATAYYHYFYGIGYYNYYSARGMAAEALLYYYSGLSTYYYYLLLGSGDQAGASLYQYYFLAYAYYYYFATYGDFSSAAFYYNLFLAYAFAS